ncbi:sugar 3,4-ketoisomerase [Culturomica massiliensis]|uniref:sugar 3,4-ketoisomerase n=1 Tax=Culturomica massiliensis TaxID=1841857 RepID=UPI00266626E1|nr:FdtA/QdtA family cupin domain-containing protein [Culturomica massiliensis]
MNVSVYDCSVIELPKITDRSGNITPVEGIRNLPFDIKRIFYSYDIPGGEARGAHAHKTCHQFLVAASGSFEIVLDDGTNKRTVLLNRPFYGLHIPPGIWAAEQGFSSGSICLVLASHGYDEQDYLRNYSDFITYRNEIKQ